MSFLRKGPRKNIKKKGPKGSVEQLTRTVVERDIPEEIKVVFTDYQIEDYIEAFQLYDTENNGCIDLKDLSEIFTSINHDYEENNLNNIIEQVDTGKTGKVNLNGFLLIAVKTFLPLVDAVDVLNAFKMLQPNDTVMTVSELCCCMSQLGDPLNKLELEAFVRMADKDNFGEFDYEELVKRLSVALDEVNKELKRISDIKEQELSNNDLMKLLGDSDSDLEQDSSDKEHDEDMTSDSFIETEETFKEEISGEESIKKTISFEFDVSTDFSQDSEGAAISD